MSDENWQSGKTEKVGLLCFKNNTLKIGIIGETVVFTKFTVDKFFFFFSSVWAQEINNELIERTYCQKYKKMLSWNASKVRNKTGGESRRNFCAFGDFSTPYILTKIWKNGPQSKLHKNFFSPLYFLKIVSDVLSDVFYPLKNFWTI